jgi:DNA-binding transcriptional ArsR family regulator
VSPSSSYGLNALKKLRIGELEKRILDVAGELGEFTLKDVCSRLGLDRRKVHKALQRLVERGFVEKPERGVYRVVSDLRDKFTRIPRGEGNDKSAKVSRRKGRDKSASGTRRIVRDKTTGGSRGVVVASSIEESRGLVRDKSAGDQFTKPIEDRFTKSTEDRFRITSEKQRVIDSGSHADRFRIPSGEAKDKSARESRGLGKDKPASDQFTKTTREHEITETAGTSSSKTPEFTPKHGERETTPSIITTTKGEEAPAEGDKQPPTESGHEISPAYRGVAPSLAGVFGFMVHRVVLGFGFGVLPHFVLSVFSNCRRVEESGQLVCSDVVGRGRVVTFEFNVKSSGGLVFLEASENPLSVGEFLGFVDWYLLQVFRRLTSREVSRSEFTVKAAPHLNSDLPGVYLEGVKSITLQDYYDEAVRTYQKKIAGRDYTRVEVEAKSWVNNNLEDVVNGLVTYAKLPAIASRLEKLSAKLEEVVEGGLSGKRIAEAVKRDIANLIYAFYLKVADVLINQFAPALAPEIGKAVKESISEFLKNIEAVRREHSKLLAEFKKLNEKVEKLTRENTELKRKIEEYELAQKQVKFDELPEEIKQLLKKLEDAGLIRAKHERVEYGYAVWKAIHDYKGNVDFWLEEKLPEVLPETARDYKLRRVVGATIKAIVHYDNRHGDKPGVPYSLWLKKFEEHLKPLTLEQGLQTIREHVAKTREEGGAESILDVLRKRLEEKTGKQGM